MATIMSTERFFLYACVFLMKTLRSVRSTCNIIMLKSTLFERRAQLITIGIETHNEITNIPCTRNEKVLDVFR